MRISPDVQRLVELLRKRILDRGISQREIARRLGYQPDYLSQLLRGNLDLKLRHVYAVLAVLELPPAGFFAELHAPTGPLGAGSASEEEPGRPRPEAEPPASQATPASKLPAPSSGTKRRGPRRSAGS